MDRPGYLETDTVARCGGSLGGNFVWSVTYTDIASGRTVNQAVWNKGAGAIVAATLEMEAALLFEILGFDCDNGREFLNWRLVRHFQERPKKVGFTRSRPCHKDDNGHVGEKNWTRARQLLGYERFEDPAALGPLNGSCREVWEPLHNFFLPRAKLKAKSRRGAKVKRKHDKPATPCDRLLESVHVPSRSKVEMREKRAALDPFELHDRPEEGLRRASFGTQFQPAYVLLALRAK